MHEHLSKTVFAGFLIAVALCAPSHAQTWEPITGADNLRKAISDTLFEATRKDGSKVTARYNADGTGELTTLGETFLREWKVDGEDLVCIKISGRFDCYRIDRSTDKNTDFRATNLSTGEQVVFSVTEEGTAQISTATTSSSGGAATPSDAELAAKLSNPTVPVMTIGNNFDYVVFEGDLPGADDQSAFRYTFQTVFPYKMSNGGSLFFRPGIPILFNDPVPNGIGGFESVGVDLGDTAFDLSYGTTTERGLIWGGGLVGTIPTATDDRLGKDQWALGPELLLGAIGKWGVVTAILSHQWDISGGADGVQTDITTLNYIYAFPLGHGWQFFSAPVITYDRSRPEDRLTLPLGVGIAKTTVLAGRPWKFQFQYWNYVKGSGAFAPEHLVRISINPVLTAPWNRDR